MSARRDREDTQVTLGFECNWKTEHDHQKVYGRWLFSPDARSKADPRELLAKLLAMARITQPGAIPRAAVVLPRDL
jgi:hypothetical protein